MIIVIFALGYFFLKLIDLLAPREPVKWALKLATLLTAIVLIFLFGVAPNRLG